MTLLNEEIRRRRELLGMSQTDLARALHVVTLTVNRWELGYCQPRPRKIKELTKFFGATEQELMFPSEEAQKIQSEHGPYNRREKIMT